jgi:hypothetical protein
LGSEFAASVATCGVAAAASVAASRIVSVKPMIGLRFIGFLQIAGLYLQGPAEVCRQALC